MNAIPQKSNSYDRLQLPYFAVSTRAHSSQNIEYLDARRAAKLAAKKKEEANKRQQVEMQQARRRELIEMRRIDRLYNQPQNGQAAMQNMAKPAKKKAAQKGGARKLTAAYEVQTKRPNKPRVNDGYSYGTGGAAAIRQSGTAATYGAAVAEPYVRNEEAAKAAPKRRGVFSTILTIALVFAMLSAVLNMYAKQSEVIYQNEQTKKTITSLQKEIEKYEMEIASREDLTSIQLRAQELGMGHPKDNQIVYLPADGSAVTADVNTAAEASVISDDAEAQSAESGDAAQGAESFLDGVKGFFAGIADTFGTLTAAAKGD